MTRRAATLWAFLAVCLLAACSVAPRPSPTAAPPPPAPPSAMETPISLPPPPPPPVLPPPKAAVEKKRKAGATAQSLRDAEEKAQALLKALQEKKRAEKTPEANGGLPSHEIAERYEKILSLPGAPAERKAEILLRLAELSFREEEAALRLFYEAGAEGDIAPGDKYPRSIFYYQRLADQYPQSPQALTAFYNLGYLYAEEGEVVRSAKAYGEILKREPKGDYSVEIHMRLGESAFSLGSYREAAAHYQAALDGGKPEYAEKALYKLGWSHYKLEDYPTAVATFSRILSSGRNAPQNLRKETVDVMARCFVEWNGAQGLAKTLRSDAALRPFGDELHFRLGELYFEASRFGEAVAAAAAGIDAYPLTALALSMEKGIIAALTAQRDVEAVNVRRQGWADRYGPGAPWDGQNGGALGAERDAMLEEGLRLAALYRHSRAQRGEGKLQLALDLYRRYDALFGMRSENGYEMAYAYAQALKEASLWAEAAARYRDVAEHLAFKAHREEAGYRRIEMLDAARRQNPSYFEEYLAAHERYVELNPAAAQAPTALFALGELLFDAERFPAARDAFSRVARDYPGHALAAGAVERLARSWFREGVYDNAEEQARRALGMALAPEARDRLLKLLSFSLLKQAEAAAADKRLDDANRHYLRLAEEFPVSELAPVSLYSVAQNLRELGRGQESAAMFRRLAETYRDSKFTESALTLSSEILSAIGDWKMVAVNYEDLYRRQPGTPEAAGHLFKAALAREKAGMKAEAAALYGEFSKTYPADARRAQALYRGGKLLDETGDEKGAVERYRLAWDAPAEGPEAAWRAKAALELGDKEFAVFKAAELKGNLQKALQKKEALLNGAINRLLDAAGLPFGDTLAAALLKAGEACEAMKTAILESERPSGMNEEEQEQYQFLLEEKAFPLEDDAVKFYRKGTEAMRSLGVYNEWVDRLFARLEALQPWAYQRSEQTAPATTALSYPHAGWEATP